MSENAGPDRSAIWTDGHLRIESVLIVQLSDRPIGVSLPNIEGSSIKDVHHFDRLPSFIEWCKVWWRYRHTRKLKKKPTLGFYMRNEEALTRSD